MDKNALFELIKQLAAKPTSPQQEKPTETTTTENFSTLSSQKSEKHDFDKPAKASQLKRETTVSDAKKPPTKDAILQMIRKHNELSAKIHEKNKKS